MFKIRFNIIILSILTCLFPNTPQAWNDERTHPDLSEIAARKSVLGNQDYLENLGFSKGLDEKFSGKEVFKWIRDGAELEDKSDTLFPLFGTTRSLNHFHNPIKTWDQWNQAGLDDWVGPLNYTGESSLLWAQNGTGQQTIVGGDWSWQKIRDYYYLALTSTTDSVRQENFARTFRGLGHQIHLLQDTAVPDHVRNDAHPEDAIFGKNIFGTAYFETWAKAQFNYINSLASNPVFPNVSFNVSYNGLAPVTQLFDAEQYDETNPSTSLTQGLAEYTNANFFSSDTIFAAERYSIGYRHYFPYPKRTSTDVQNYIDGTKLAETVTAADGTQDTAVWISKVQDGETINHFVRPGYFTESIYNLFGEGNLFYSSFYRDEVCHQDYALLLIPPAVGYSAGLLNYFFRGKFNIIQTGAYSFQIINFTDEDMDGTFELYYDNTSDQRISLWSGDFAIEKLSSGNNKTSNISVDFSSVTDAKEPGEYMLVFKGRIGNEGVAPYDTEYAVAAQKITPHFLTHVYIPADDQWDIYEYDLLGNRIYNITGGLTRGEVYYDGNPNPTNPDKLIYVKNSGCLENSSCLHLLMKSTGESINMNRYGVFWWSKDGQRIYTQDKYYDFSSETWKTRVMNSCSYAISYSSFSQDESKLVVEGLYYNPSTNEYDLYDVLVLTDWNVSHVVDMKVNTRSLVNVDSVTCEGYGTDENFFDSIPDFHPSEDKIIFTSDADGGPPAFPFNIYLADISTGNIQQLTNASDEDMGYYEAVWSPDGQTILMAGEKKDESSEIYSLPALGGAPEKITSDGFNHYYPKWIRYLGQ